MTGTYNTRPSSLQVPYSSIGAVTFPKSFWHYSCTLGNHSDRTTYWKYE